MNRRRFIKDLAVTAAAAEALEAIEPPPQEPASTDGYTLIPEYLIEQRPDVLEMSRSNPRASTRP